MTSTISAPGAYNYNLSPLHSPYMPNDRSFEHPRNVPGRPTSWAVPRLRSIDEEAQVVDVRRRVSWLENNIRHHIISIIGEFVGTFSFLFFSFAAAQIAGTKTSPLAPGVSTPDLLQVFFIASAFGVSLAVNAWIFYRVVFGLFLIGVVPWRRALLVIPVQILGATAAAATVGIVLPGDITFTNSLGNNASVAQGLFIEFFGTSILLFTIMMMAVEKHRATFVAPLAIGMALFLGHMLAINYTGAGLNPARALGPAIATGTFPSYHWIYYLGPFLGAALAALLHGVLKYLKYEDCRLVDLTSRKTN